MDVGRRTTRPRSAASWSSRARHPEPRRLHDVPPMIDEHGNDLDGDLRPRDAARRRSPAPPAATTGGASRSSPDAEEFQRFLQAREFPAPLDVLDTAVDRRGFLQLMGASLALAGLGACTRQPTEKIVPYVQAPEQIVPGEPLFFATRDSARRLRHRPAGREPHGPADQDRGQSRASGEPRRDRRAHAGVGARALRSRSLAGGHARRRDPPVERLRRRAHRCAEAPRAHGRRRAPHPHRDRHLADARRRSCARCSPRTRRRAGISTSR